MSLLDNANRFVRASLTARNGKLFTYTAVGSGAPAPFLITGKTGATFSRLETEDAYTLNLAGDDVLIDATALLEKLGRDPKRGDRLTRNLGRSTVTFEVLPNSGEPEWRWVDSDQTEYRIHVKCVATTLN